MTEHEKDRIAYEACGYTEADIADIECGIFLDPWSSADAAIAHAERGKWYIADCYDAAIDGYRGNERFHLRLKRHPSPGFVEYASGIGPTPGLAIRNAILNSLKDPMKNAVSADELGIDWNRAKKNKTRLESLPVIGDPITDMENDLTNRKRSS